MRNLFLKTLYDKRVFIIGWSVGLAFLAYIIAIFYPAFSQGDMIAEMTESIPPALQGFMGDMAAFSQFDTFIANQTFEANLPIFACILAILLAVGLTVGEEDKGLLRTVAATPTSRSRIIFEKWLAIVVISIIASVITIVGTWLGALQIGESIDSMALLRLGTVMALLLVALSSFIFAVGAATGKRGLTTAVGIVVAIGSFILSTFAIGVDWLKDFAFLSIFHYFPATEVLQGTLQASTFLVYGALTIVSLAVAIIFFRRRDIG